MAAEFAGILRIAERRQTVGAGHHQIAGAEHHRQIAVRHRIVEMVEYFILRKDCIVDPSCSIDPCFINPWCSNP